VTRAHDVYNPIESDIEYIMPYSASSWTASVTIPPDAVAPETYEIEVDCFAPVALNQSTRAQSAQGESKPGVLETFMFQFVVSPPVPLPRAMLVFHSYTVNSDRIGARPQLLKAGELVFPEPAPVAALSRRDGIV